MNVICPNPACGIELTCEDSMGGLPVKCPGCNQVFVAAVKTPELVAAGGESGGATGPQFGTATSAPAPAATASPADTPAVSALTRVERRDAVGKVIQSLIMIGACIALQYVVDLLPGMDVNVGRAPLHLWVKTGLAVAILVLMLRLLAPLRIVTNYYIGLMFRVSSTLGGERQLQDQVSAAGLYLVLILYVGFVYQTVLRWVLRFLGNLVGLPPNLLNLIKLAFAAIGIILAIKLILALKPLTERLSKSITDRTMNLTEQIDSKPCPSCGSRIDRSAKFCPSCGKAA